MGACQGTPASAWEHIPQVEARPSPYVVVRDALTENGDDWPRTNAAIAVDALVRSGHLPEYFGGGA